MPAGSLPKSPPILADRLLPRRNALLPIALLQFRRFGRKLKPRYIVGARTLDQ